MQCLRRLTESDGLPRSFLVVSALATGIETADPLMESSDLPWQQPLVGHEASHLRNRFPHLHPARPRAQAEQIV